MGLINVLGTCVVCSLAVRAAHYYAMKSMFGLFYHPELFTEVVYTAGPHIVVFVACLALLVGLLKVKQHKLARGF